MAVFTTLQLNQVGSILDAVGLQDQLGEPLSLTPMSDGITNTTYKLTTSDGEYGLHLLEESPLRTLSAHDIVYYTQQLIQQGAPITPYVGQAATWNGKECFLSQWVTGEQIQKPVPREIYLTSRALAHFHNASLNVPVDGSELSAKRNGGSLIGALSSYARSMVGIAGSIITHGNVSLEDLLACAKPDCLITMQAVKHATTDLPKGLIHGDVWQSNIIYHGDDVTFIDMEKLKYSCLVKDLAQYIYSSCHDGKGHINPELVKTAIGGYQTERCLSQDELLAIPLLIKQIAYLDMAAAIYRGGLNRETSEGVALALEKGNAIINSCCGVLDNAIISIAADSGALGLDVA
ncbi:phosphotransferase [bacterium]|nr:phosphotransferase [bacterium]